MYDCCRQLALANTRATQANTRAITNHTKSIVLQAEKDALQAQVDQLTVRYTWGLRYRFGAYLSRRGGDLFLTMCKGFMVKI